MSVEFHCPSCGKKLFTYEVRAVKYESPLKECKKCNAKYLDPRCKELAITGIPKSEFGMMQYALILVIGVLIGWRGYHMLGMRQLGVASEIQWVLPVCFMLIGAGLIIGAICSMISIKTGLKAKKFDRLYEESRDRMRDMSYVYTLQKLGYDVPEEFTGGSF